MAQPRWTMILVRIAPMGVLLMIVLSILIMNLQNNSLQTTKNNFQNFRPMFLKEQNIMNSIVPIREFALDLKNNLSKYIMQNVTQFLWPIKETIKYGIANGFIIILNASTQNEVNSIYVAASQHRATSSSWDINGAFDGYMGELIAQIIEEMSIVEKAQDAIVENIKKYNYDNNLERKPIWKNISQETLKSINDWPYKLQWYGPSLHSLVVFSSFRFSQTHFFVVALIGTLPLEKSWSKEFELHTCMWIQWQQTSTNLNTNSFGSSWHDNSRPTIQMGIQNVTITNALNRTIYDVAVIKCTFEDPAGADAKGGHLYIKINNEFCPVFVEKPEQINTIQFEGKFKYDFAFCSPPILWNFDVTYLKQWFMYHHFLFHVRKTHYFIYHGINMTKSIMEILDPFIEQGLLTLIDIRSSQNNFLSGQYPHHNLAINDCLHRVRYLSKWAFFWNFEDYLTISSPHSISSILNKYKNNPWISLGSILWSNKYCCALDYQTIMLKKTMWIVDEMCFRNEHPICNDKAYSTTCSGIQGQRKWIANPRLVFVASIHSVLDSESNGVVLDTHVARFNVYKGLLNPNLSKNNCMSIIMPKDFDDDIPLDGIWWKDLSMRDYTEAAHFYSSSTKLFNSNFINSSPKWLFNTSENNTIS